MMYWLWKKTLDAAYWYETHTTGRFGNWLVMRAEGLSDKYCKRYMKEKMDAALWAKGIDPGTLSYVVPRRS